MKKTFLVLLSFLLFSFSSKAEIISRIVGHISDTSLSGWFCVKNEPSYTLLLENASTHSQIKKEVVIQAYKQYRYSSYTFDGLAAGNAYILYRVLPSGQKDTLNSICTTETNPNSPKDISFLAGSCAYMGGYKPFASKRIFEAMEKEKKIDFMFWLGDNLYYIFPDLVNYSFTQRKNLKTRRQKQLNAFLASVPHYAIWDDHDYGYDNADSSFHKNHLTDKAFREFWPNPPYEKGSTLYYTVKKEDIELFCLDDKSHANWDKKVILSEEQLNFLKADLLRSTATFKFIVCGMQITNKDCEEEHANVPETQREEILGFIEKNKIEGVIFLSGDRHFAELLQTYEPTTYPLYELTTSPLTSWALRPKEAGNKLRIRTFQGRNYAKISVTGEKNKRVCTLNLRDEYGKTVWEERIEAANLKFP